MLNKDGIRRAMRERRRALTPEERTAASEIICAKLAVFNFHSPIAVYLASPQEIDLSPFIRKILESGVKVVAPRWNGETYELVVLKGLDGAYLRKGPMGILEPAEAEIVSRHFWARMELRIIWYNLRRLGLDAPSRRTSAIGSQEKRLQQAFGGRRGPTYSS